PLPSARIVLPIRCPAARFCSCTPRCYTLAGGPVILLMGGGPGPWVAPRLTSRPLRVWNIGPAGCMSTLLSPAAGVAMIEQIRHKVQAGERLSLDDGLYLSEHVDLCTLGELANIVRERKNGNFAYYNVNTHLNPTNVCVYRCTFCAFRADLKSPKGYVMTDE